MVRGFFLQLSSEKVEEIINDLKKMKTDKAISLFGSVAASTHYLDLLPFFMQKERRILGI